MEQPIKIEILDIDNYHRQMEKNFLQHFFSNKTLIPILIYFGIGMFFLISGFLSGYDIEHINLRNGQEKVTLYNYGISIGIGCGLILYSIFTFLDNRKSKNAEQILFSIRRNREKRANEKVEFLFSENKISYSSSLNSWSKKWEFYDYYKMTNNNLNLYSKRFYSDLPELVIPLNDLSSEQIELLKKYISGKVKNYS